MINLNGTSALIQVITTTAADIHVHATWVDRDSTAAITPDSDNTLISSATTTTVVSSPSGTNIRNVEALLLHNAHASTSNVVTVNLLDNTPTTSRLWTGTMAPGDSLSIDRNGKVTYLSVLA